MSANEPPPVSSPRPYIRYKRSTCYGYWSSVTKEKPYRDVVVFEFWTLAKPVPSSTGGGHLATSIGCERIEDERGQRRRRVGHWTETWLSWSRTDNIGRRNFPSSSQRCWRSPSSSDIRPPTFASPIWPVYKHGKLFVSQLRVTPALPFRPDPSQAGSTPWNLPGNDEPRGGRTVEIGQHEVKFHVLANKLGLAD